MTPQEQIERLKAGPQTLNAKWLDPECWDGCQSLVWKQKLEQAQKQNQALREALREAADNAYVRGCEMLKKTECLGVEYKMSTGRFGKVEFEAHISAAEQFGFYKLAHAFLRQMISPTAGRDYE